MSEPTRFGRTDYCKVQGSLLPCFTANKDELPLGAGATGQAHSRRWIVDSGASEHLCTKEGLTKEELLTVRPVTEPQSLQTANGEVTPDEQADVWIVDLGAHIT